MQYGMYAVHDAAVKAFMQPFFMRTNEEAQRAIEAVCLNPEHNFVRFSAHYTLYRIGFYDEASGIVEASEPKEYICRVSDCCNSPIITNIEEVA